MQFTNKMGYVPMCFGVKCAPEQIQKMKISSTMKSYQIFAE